MHTAYFLEAFFFIVAFSRPPFWIVFACLNHNAEYLSVIFSIQITLKFMTNWNVGLGASHYSQGCFHSTPALYKCIVAKILKTSVLFTTFDVILPIVHLSSCCLNICIYFIIVVFLRMHSSASHFVYCKHQTTHTSESIGITSIKLRNN